MMREFVSFYGRETKRVRRRGELGESACPEKRNESATNNEGLIYVVCERLSSLTPVWSCGGNRSLSHTQYYIL